MSRQHFPNRWLIITALLLGTFTAPADENDLAARLSTVYLTFNNGEHPIDVAVLVQLDQELREIVAEVNERDRLSSQKYLKVGYEKLGLNLNHWAGNLQYTGKLLSLAHSQDPNSEFRSRTLFAATRYDETKFLDMGKLPDVNAAHQYAREFPRGPHIAVVYEILATFYDDLYKYIRGEWAHDANDDHELYEACYKPYLQDTPLQQQLVQAQSQSIAYHDEALRTVARDPEKAKKLKNQRASVRNGTTHGFYWCSAC